MLSRRQFLVGAALASAAPFVRASSDRLPPWTAGLLDIHHISTHQGDATLIVAPDGTTILIDAGATAESGPAVLEARPDASRSAGEWIGRYVQRRLNDTGGDAIDTLLVTHLHPDHINGIPDVARMVPIRRVIDSGYPEYSYPPFEDANASERYVKWVREQKKVERWQVGSNEQIRLERGASSVPFHVRNLAGMGTVWRAGTRFDATDRPNVNACSIALRLQFGRFSYFCAGDLTSWADAGVRPNLDALTPAALAAGPVDVAVAPHHGLFDASNSEMVRALSARAWIISAWHASHPSISTLERLFNPRLFAGPRDVYATGLHDAVRLTASRLTRQLASDDGHVIVRVAADGASYRIFVTSNRDENDRLILSSPALAARGGVA
ncbi:MAG TPA: MBL fold metallo-hydrolase [Steroidobacter sp.]|uniref:ComEC/Rec2 family competence protein n=1 Tax=Steroidobacter sp. TaxID=1978227 RepID=UPI002ED7F83B